MTHVIELGELESAEPGTCGACKHNHRNGMRTGRGECLLRLPPWIRLQHTHASKVDGRGVETFENSGDAHLVYDRQTCSFWTASGFTYTKQRTWTVDK